MSDPSFHADVAALLRQRNWAERPPDEVDDDVRIVISAAMEIYLSGRRPPPPRPMHEILSTGRGNPPPRPLLPSLLSSVYGLVRVGAGEGP